jgi:hypothetical protein
MDGRSGLIRTAAMLDAEALLGQLCGVSLRLLCGELGAHKQGLSAAARAAFQQGFIGSRTKKKLLEVDTAHQYARHVTAEKVAEFVAELRAELVGSSLSSRDVGGSLVDNMKFDSLPDHYDTTKGGNATGEFSGASGYASTGTDDCVMPSPRSSVAERSDNVSGSDLPRDFYVGDDLVEGGAQTDLSFPVHDMAAIVPECADSFFDAGFITLAHQVLSRHSACTEHVRCVLDGAPCLDDMQPPAIAEFVALANDEFDDNKVYTDCEHVATLLQASLQALGDLAAECEATSAQVGFECEGEQALDRFAECAHPADSLAALRCAVGKPAEEIKAELYTHLVHTMCGVDGFEVLDVEVDWYESQGQYEVIVTYAGNWNKESATRLHELILSCDCMGSAEFAFFGVARRKGRRHKRQANR